MFFLAVLEALGIEFLVNTCLSWILSKYSIPEQRHIQKKPIMDKFLLQADQLHTHTKAL